MQQEERRSSYGPRQNKTCILCGSVIGKFRTHIEYHNQRGEQIPQRVRKSQGFCSDCGDKIEFKDGSWRHETIQGCRWQRGTERSLWAFAPCCGIRLSNGMTPDHRCN